MSVTSAGYMMLPEWVVLAGGGVAVLAVVGAIMLFMAVWTNELVRLIIQAQRGGRRLAMVHYPSGQVRFAIPKLVEEDGNNSPYWEVEGTVRFKDVTGEKWESCGDLKILHYTARCPTPIGSSQCIALDQLNTMLAWRGFATKGFIKHVFYMIAESAKGRDAEEAAWSKLQIKDQDVRGKIKEILDYLKANPEVRYMMFQSGAFTYQTAVSVVDQIIGTNVSNVSDTISFVEDRTRRKLADRTSELMKYVVIAVPLIIATSIAAVIFLVGGGFL